MNSPISSDSTTATVPAKYGPDQFTQHHIALIDALHNGARPKKESSTRAVADHLRKMMDGHLYRTARDEFGRVLFATLPDYLKFLRKELGRVVGKHRSSAYRLLYRSNVAIGLEDAGVELPKEVTILSALLRFRPADQPAILQTTRTENPGVKLTAKLIDRAASSSFGYEIPKGSPSASEILAKVRRLSESMAAAVEADDGPAALSIVADVYRQITPSLKKETFSKTQRSKSRNRKNGRPSNATHGGRLRGEEKFVAFGSDEVGQNHIKSDIVSSEKTEAAGVALDPTIPRRPENDKDSTLHTWNAETVVGPNGAFDSISRKAELEKGVAPSAADLSDAARSNIAINVSEADRNLSCSGLGYRTWAKGYNTFVKFEDDDAYCQLRVALPDWVEKFKFFEKQGAFFCRSLNPKEAIELMGIVDIAFRRKLEALSPKNLEKNTPLAANVSVIGSQSKDRNAPCLSL